MDRRQRFADVVEQFRSAFEGMQSEIQTAAVGTIESYDADALTCTVQPGIMAQVTAQDGARSWVELPLLLDCPVQFPAGGGFTLTFPLTQGDECLVVFSGRCLDNWFAQTGEQGPSGLTWTQAELRMHDLSDGCVIPGIRNKNRASQLDASTTDVQLRSDAGTAVISIRENSDIYIHSDVNVIVDADGDVTVQAEGDITATAGGNLLAQATGNAEVEAGGTLILVGTTAITAAAPIISLTAPVINLVGAVDISGSLVVNGKDFTTHNHLPGTYQAGTTHITGNSGAPV